MRSKATIVAAYIALRCLFFLPIFLPSSLAHSDSCLNDRKIPFDIQRHDRVYKVGVLAIRGFEAAQLEFNRTFDHYLTATAGQRFDPPLSFELVPLNFMGIFTEAEARSVDFVYLNPSAYSCIESEFTAYSLVSQISRRKVNGGVYDLEKFGGVIMARADSDIYELKDLRNKVIAAASLSGLGSGQMQFLELQNAGMSYIQDPSQLVFTSNQEIVVNGVLSGEFDVGFVRTDQIERTTDANDVLVDPSLFRIINPKPSLTIEGEPFPFNSSTPLYPEWNVAALDHVSDDVSRAVQSALLALAEHGQIGLEISQCREENSTDYCQAVFDNSTKARCDTTPQVAMIAHEAMAAGKYAKWQPTLSYMQLRSMQQVTGFIYQDSVTKDWKCYRSSELYDTITCPEGYNLKPRDQVAKSCAAAGLPCTEGYQCVCHPCSLIEVCINGVEISGDCIPYKTLLPAILVPFFVLCAIFVHFYVEYKRRQGDSVWEVKPDELEFDNPAKIIGIGTFGFVIAAEYRGTKVAVKRVIPPNVNKKKWLFSQRYNPRGASQNFQDTSYSNAAASDIESQAASSIPGYKSVFVANTNRQSRRPSRQISDDSAVDNPGLQSMASHMLHHRASGAALPLYNNTESTSVTYKQLKADFLQEMRHIARLRHPCITTVMGACISRLSEPMLVMEYMELGSLHDVLRSDQPLDNDERLMPILQDIAQGVRFLHAAHPQVIHGDLKSKNVLVDSNYRAKVTDFGLSAKKENSASGTPFWMAPELLRRESTNTARSDMYAFGVLMYEIYSRKNPYEGQGRDHNEVLKQVSDPNVNLRPPIPSSCPSKVAELMRMCWAAQADMRPSAEHVDVVLRVEGSVKERTSRLEKLNRDLEAANEKIAAASSMQLEHFACMSHEIRTPLNCIVGLSSLMEDSDLTPPQKDSMSMIMSSSRLLQSIVDDVLDYSKLQSGSLELQIQRTDVQEVVTKLVQSMRASSLVRKRNVTIRTHFHPSVSRYIKTDGRKLVQILFNLVSNAAKFSRDDGVVEVKLEVCDAQEEVVQSCHKKQEKVPLVSFSVDKKQVVRFRVKDFGKGIEKKHFHSIFKPFAQTNSGINNIDGGTGLGLAITENLVKALGGSISVDSVMKEWTEFTVDLPFDEPPFRDESVSSRLRGVEFFFVGERESAECKRIEEMFQYYKLSFSAFSSIDELKKKLGDRQPSPSKPSYCFASGDLFQDGALLKLSNDFQVKLIALGQQCKPSGACAYYDAISEIIPSFLLVELSDLVERHKGACMHISVASESKSNEDDTHVDLSGLKVLIAEDNLVNQKILSRMLKRLGLEHVEVVDNGKKAVDRDAEVPFDIILMDMQMPVMGGVEATQQIMKRQGGHPIPMVVFVTAHVSPSFEATCYKSGGTAYLPKPYTVAELKKTLHNVVAQT